MKSIKIILTTALSFWMVQSFAQTPLESLRVMFATSPVSMECDYSTMIQNTKVAGHSEILVQGDMYTMRGNGLEIFCDGTDVWTVDESAQEVIIESCSLQDCDYMSNPALLLADLDSVFKVDGSRSVGSGNVEYTLAARTTCGVSKAVVVLAQDGKIVKADFIMDDGTALEVNVASMKKAEEKQMSFFSPGRKFGSDWIVTNLR